MIGSSSGSSRLSRLLHRQQTAGQRQRRVSIAIIVGGLIIVLQWCIILKLNNVQSQTNFIRSQTKYSNTTPKQQEAAAGLVSSSCSDAEEVVVVTSSTSIPTNNASGSTSTSSSIKGEGEEEEEEETDADHHHHNHNNNQSQQKPEYNNNNYFTPNEIYTMQPKVWRDWLKQHRELIRSISLLRKATVERGSGFSMKIDFFNNNNDDNHDNTNTTNTNTTITRRPSQSQSQSQRRQQYHSGYFKSAHPDYEYYKAESHLREIKAYYLDRILGTNVVLPCVGYRFDTNKYSSILDKKDRDFLQEELNVLKQNPYYVNIVTPHTTTTTTTKDGSVQKDLSGISSRNNNSTFSGALVIWLDGTESIEKSELMKAPLLSSTNNSTRSSPPRGIMYKQSAISYFVFGYLANCMKSLHNHFYNQPQNRFTAIDNDRCFTPTRISNGANNPNYMYDEWKQIIIDEIQCDDYFQLTTIIQLVEERRRSNNNRNNNNSFKTISQRLKEALKEDVLAKELLAIQPETFEEIDQRFDILAQRIDSCFTTLALG